MTSSEGEESSSRLSRVLQPHTLARLQQAQNLVGNEPPSGLNWGGALAVTGTTYTQLHVIKNKILPRGRMTAASVGGWQKQS